MPSTAPEQHAPAPSGSLAQGGNEIAVPPRVAPIDSRAGAREERLRHLASTLSLTTAVASLLALYVVARSDGSEFVAGVMLTAVIALQLVIVLETVHFARRLAMDRAPRAVHAIVAAVPLLNVGAAVSLGLRASRRQRVLRQAHGGW